jgi:hypothetical protein
MKRRLENFVLMILVGAILVAPLMSKSHRFRLAESASLYAIELQPGEYELKIYDDVASIYQGKKLIAVVSIRIEPIEDAVENSTVCCEGVLKEVRLQEQRVLFVEPVPTTQSGG